MSTKPSTPTHQSPKRLRHKPSVQLSRGNDTGSANTHAHQHCHGYGNAHANGYLSHPPLRQARTPPPTSTNTPTPTRYPNHYANGNRHIHAYLHSRGNLHGDQHTAPDIYSHTATQPRPGRRARPLSQLILPRQLRPAHLHQRPPLPVRPR